MYSLDNVNKTVQDITSYVKQCMSEKKLGVTEIREYETQCKCLNFDEFLHVSQEYIDMLNNMEKEQECKVTYLW